MKNNNIKDVFTQKKSQTIRISTAILVTIVIAIIAFILGNRFNASSYLSTVSNGVKGDQSVDFTKLESLSNKLKQYYDGEIKNDTLLEGAKRGLVAASGDKYTTYFSKKDAEEFSNELNGNLSGIGAEIGVRNDRPTILRTFEGTPAREAGLKRGDAIYGVDGLATKGWDASDAAKKIRGEKGTKVKLYIKRGSETKDVEVVRDTIHVPSVEYKETEGVAIIRLSRFDSDSAGEFRAAAQRAKRDGVKGLIVDLRGNGGGVLDAAVRIAGLWLPNGKEVVSQQTGGKVTEVLKVSGADTILKDMKTVVLVDGDSASASEILAGALKDHGVVELVGKKTFGKGTVQQLVDLEDGGKLKVTIAHWYTPNGLNIAKEGIPVDNEVDLSLEDLNQDRDPQMKAALGYFK